MKLITLPEVAEKTGCFVFGHDWSPSYKGQKKCMNCGERRGR